MKNVNQDRKNIVIDFINESLKQLTEEHMNSYSTSIPTIKNNLDFLHKLKLFLENSLKSSEHMSVQKLIVDEIKGSDVVATLGYYRDVKSILSDELNNFTEQYYEFLTQQINTQLQKDEKCSLSMAYEDYWLKIHLELHVVMPRFQSTLRTLKREVA